MLDLYLNLAAAFEWVHRNINAESLCRIVEYTICMVVKCLIYLLTLLQQIETCLKKSEYDIKNLYVYGSVSLNLPV